MTSNLMYHEDVVVASAQSRFVLGGGKQGVVAATARHGPRMVFVEVDTT